MATDWFWERVRLVELGSDSPFVCEGEKLLKEYGNYMYEELGLTAGKENFFNELEQFPTTHYLPPLGVFMIARSGEMSAGCVGIKTFDEQSCEMKRLFVRASFRGKGLGKFLCNYTIDWCRKKGYGRILLDTNLEMKEAIALYHGCGFREREPYRVNENKHPVFMEYIL